MGFAILIDHIALIVFDYVIFLVGGILLLLLAIFTIAKGRLGKGSGK
jgi:hypothetical protein